MIAIGAITLIVSIGLVAGGHKGRSRSTAEGLAVALKLRRVGWVMIALCSLMIAFGVILALL